MNRRHKKNGSQTNTKTLTEQIYEQRQSETVDIALIQERKKMVEAAKEKAYGKIYATIFWQIPTLLQI